jgi:ribose/xylose/arabinose/galactoside ABC-type transport system permease subunit
MTLLKKDSFLREYFREQAVPLIVLLLMIIIASVVSPVFLTANNFKNIVIQIAVNVIVSMGMFMVILTGGIDLSVGSMVAVSCVLCAGFMQNFPVGVAIFVSIVVCVALGTINGMIVSLLKIAPFIVTLGMMSFARGIAFWYTKSLPISWLPFPGADFLYAVGTGNIFSIPYLALIWIFMVFLTFVVLKYTIVGRIIYSIGGNETAVLLSGLNVKAWKILPYLLSGLCTGIGGVVLAARLGVGTPTGGTNLEMDSIAAVVIGGASFSGGIGNVSGVIIGAFVLGIINNILDLMNVPSYPQMMLKGAIIVAAVVLSKIRENNLRG